MSDLDSQVPYWDAAVATKTFTHPLHLPWLDRAGRHAAILDYGCGYGRIMKELEQRGFSDLTGVDASPACSAGHAFRTTDTRTVTVHTMNGHESTGIQILARKLTSA
ncbi:class I SAM-dependent methyltransferase [Streptomyces nodosus]|uniref:class I SAM-dependent methyltransferase n=1 Tax=Streptomyces nodosus TaxID=40318 RepID=UPI0034557FF1